MNNSKQRFLELIQQTNSNMKKAKNSFIDIGSFLKDTSSVFEPLHFSAIRDPSFLEAVSS